MLETEPPQANPTELEVNMMDLDRERRHTYLRSYKIAVSYSLGLKTMKIGGYLLTGRLDRSVHSYL